MARIQLENRLGVTLQRVLFTGRSYTVEPPEIIPPNARVFWLTDDCGAVTYDAVPSSITAAVTAGSVSINPPASVNSPVQPPATSPPAKRQLTLTWQFSKPGRPHYLTRNVDASIRVRVREQGEGAIYNVTTGARRRASLAPRRPRAGALVAAVAVVLLLATASAAAYGLAGGRLFRSSGTSSDAQQSGQPGSPSGPNGITQAAPTATFTPTPTPTPTPTATPVPLSLTVTPRSNAVSVQQGQLATGSVSCGSGEVLLGGGFSGDDNALYIYGYPSNASTWTVSVYGNAGYPGTYTATIYADCARANFALSTMVVSSSPATNYSAAVTCPAGRRAIGGGVSTSGAGHRVEESYLTNNGWRAAAPSYGTFSVTAFAICVSSPYLKVTTVMGGFTMPANGSGTGTAACPSGRLLASAGFNAPGINLTPGIVVLLSRPNGAHPSSWTVGALNYVPSTVNVGVVLACLTY